MYVIVNVLNCTENNVTMHKILMAIKIGFIFMISWVFLRFTHLDGDKTYCTWNTWCSKKFTVNIIVDCEKPLKPYFLTHTQTFKASF